MHTKSTSGTVKVYLAVMAVLTGFGITGASWVGINSRVATHAAKLDAEARRMAAVEATCRRHAETITEIRENHAGIVANLENIDRKLSRIEAKLDR